MKHATVSNEKKTIVPMAVTPFTKSVWHRNSDSSCCGSCSGFVSVNILERRKRRRLVLTFAIDWRSFIPCTRNRHWQNITKNEVKIPSKTYPNLDPPTAAAISLMIKNERKWKYRNREYLTLLGLLKNVIAKEIMDKDKIKKLITTYLSSNVTLQNTINIENKEVRRKLTAE